MEEQVFLTGATGFLGTNIALDLIKNTNMNIYALIRAENVKEAEKKLLRLWYDTPQLRESVGKRVFCVPGDITVNHLGIEKSLYRGLTESVRYVIHSAAEVDLRKTREELFRVNVHGTANVLAFAKDINSNAGLKRFSHVSTAYVAGLAKGVITEKISGGQGFASLYEESKYEAEILVKNHEQFFPVSIFRPGQIVGNSETGEISSFNTIYYPLKLFLNNRLRVIPAKKDARINLIPVDYVADAIVRLTADARAEGLIFNLVAPAGMQPTAKELLDFVMDWAEKKPGLKLKKPVFINIPLFSRLGAIYNLSGVLRKKRKTLLSNLIALAPYFNENREYKTENSARLLGEFTHDWRKYLPKLLDYAVYKGFLDHSGRTVSEQLLFRAGSKRYPVNYYNITEAGTVKVTGSSLVEEINKTVSALSALGVCKGSKVAIIGRGCTGYIAIDTAVSIIGAVSVPLYITTPLKEIDALLEKSGSKILFVGSINLLEQLGQLKQKVKIISFGNGEVSGYSCGEVLSWEKFLSLGVKSIKVEGTDFSDTATIRFTSGTTGIPKGAVFNQYSLKWMAESLASLISWKMRNTRARYLSFLPMSHVVEGILASYACYYNLCKLDIYYLENTNQLAKALPKVKPTFFFSVPRFYEKLWEGFCNSRAGSFYTALENGRLKNLIRPVIRKAILRKAGLQKCLQMVVGSAPMSNELLKAFRELGIEIHNAYGLTEAPLVTLNRLGNNEPGTVGEPLPQTDIRIADDGEILVKGPQVTCGYYGDEEKATSGDGWLHTGDLGEITECGKLVVSGRKKEIIITSYGKNIMPLKIESKLKDIDFTTEAILIGNSRPYCTAILWTDKRFKNQSDYQGFSQQIENMNAELSNPEKIKRWAIVKRQLSVNNGELTPTLKLKRKVVMERYREVIGALYDDTPMPEYVLSTGKADI